MMSEILPSDIYQTIHPNALAGRVAAQNRANELAIRLHGELLEKFRPFLGQKIIKSNGGWPKLMKKIEAAIGELYKEPMAHVFLSSVQYSLRYLVRVDRMYNNGREHHPTSNAQGEANICVGSLEGDILEKLNEETPRLRIDYSESEIRRLRAAYREASDKANEAKSALNPFGEYDNR